MKHLRAFFVMLLACCCVALSACGSSFTEEDYNSSAKISGADRYTSEFFAESNFSDSSSYSCNADQFNGWHTVLSKTYSADTEITVSIVLSVSSGMAKAVFFNAGDEMTTIAECTEEAKEVKIDKTLSVKSGDFKIKFVALNGVDVKLSVRLR